MSTFACRMLSVGVAFLPALFVFGDGASRLAMAYRRQRERVNHALGEFRVYVYTGGPFDAATIDLLRRAGSHFQYQIAEETAEVWVHRAVLASRRRTLDPERAELYFVPAYLRLARRKPELIDAMLANVTSSPWFQRRQGADHIFGYSSVNPTVARELGFSKISRAMPNAFRACFEVNPAWVHLPGTEAALDRLIVMPYVVNANIFQAARKPEKKIGIFFYANRRPNAVRWGNCNRSKAHDLAELSDTVVKFSQRRLSTSPGKVEAGLVKFAEIMGQARYCLVMCGDTPTSRRLFDAIVSHCVPLIVGSRLEGRCDPPCRPGWGWFVSGPSHSHLPFNDIYIDYSVFPHVNETSFSADAVRAVEAAYISPHRRAELIAYMREIADDLIYGYGSFADPTRFGRAVENLLDSALLRLRASASPYGIASLKPNFQHSLEET